MDISNYELVSTDTAFSDIEVGLRNLLLDGVDVRLQPVGAYRALLRKHVVVALRRQYPDGDPWELISALGAKAHRPVSDEAAIALIGHRMPEELDPRPVHTPPRDDGIEWHLGQREGVNAVAAWSLLGGPHAIPWAVKVGQIDTGYTRHPGLGFGSVTWIDTAACRNFFYPGQDEASGGRVAGSPDGTDPIPLSGANGGHGTRIGATISGYLPGGDKGRDFFGCAPKVPHVVARISDSVLINDQMAAFADALNYLVDTAKVSAVNLSMGTFPPGLTAEARHAVNHAYERGVILVCAAGNHVDPVVAPACFSRSVAVGGVTRARQVWSGSSFGAEVDWSAPAADIRRAHVSRTGGFSFAGGGDGTSYATALTTGAAALWLTYRRAEIATHYTYPWQRVAAFRLLGAQSALRPVGWQDGALGAGILDVHALLSRPLPAAAALVQEAAL